MAEENANRFWQKNEKILWIFLQNGEKCNYFLSLQNGSKMGMSYITESVLKIVDWNTVNCVGFYFFF